MGVLGDISGKISRRLSGGDRPVSDSGQKRAYGKKESAPTPGTAAVRNIIAVASGKGGVGKSTTAINLARALASRSLKVGFLDADIYGPSLSVLAGRQRPAQPVGQTIIPPESGGIRQLSVSMFSPEGRPQVLRGPVVASLVRQFLLQVAWGELDYLIIDYPPGTGDVQLTISQVVSLTGAVIVTTPQEMSLVDVRKSVVMFETLNVPVLGLVENMSFFLCDSCDKKHFLFGQSGGKSLATQLGLPLLAEIPVENSIRRDSDLGRDFISDPEHDSVKAARWYQALASSVTEELARLTEGTAAGLGSFSLNWKTEQSGPHAGGLSS